MPSTYNQNQQRLLYTRITNKTYVYICVCIYVIFLKRIPIGICKLLITLGRSKNKKLKQQTLARIKNVLIQHYVILVHINIFQIGTMVNIKSTDTKFETIVCK